MWLQAVTRCVYRKEPSEKTTKEVTAQMRAGNDISLHKKPMRMMLGSVANISPREEKLLNYLFSNKGIVEDIVGRYFRRDCVYFLYTVIELCIFVYTMVFRCVDFYILLY